MEINGICKYCGVDTGDKTPLCNNCYETIVKPYNENWEKNHSTIHTKGTVYIKGYGNESVARVDELLRRVPLNMKKDGTYDVGRRCENGTIAEREPNY